MDAPWERSGPSWEESRIKFISALIGSPNDYSIETINKYVDKFMDENFDKKDRYPVGSDRGFWMTFDDNLDEIVILISKENTL